MKKETTKDLQSEINNLKIQVKQLQQEIIELKIKDLEIESKNTEVLLRIEIRYT